MDTTSVTYLYQNRAVTQPFVWDGTSNLFTTMAPTGIAWDAVTLQDASTYTIKMRDVKNV